MKKAIKWLVGACLALALAAFAPAGRAESGTIGSLNWTLADGVLTVTGTGEIYSVMINEDMSGSLWDDYNDRITRVVVGEGITGIGPRAFFNLYRMTSISLPSTLTYIGYEAFRDSRLQEITIPENVTSVGQRAFGGSAQLKSATILGHLDRISDYTFINCTSLERVLIADGPSTVGMYAFAYCGKLRVVVIPPSVETVQAYAFYSNR